MRRAFRDRKRLLKPILTGLALAMMVALGSSAVAQAHGFRSGTNAGVADGETVNSTMFVSGRTIEIAGTVNGDVFCAGQNITVNGTVNGDVICAGQTVRVDGEVNGDVRVAGQTVNVGGTVSGNLTAAGQSVTTESGSSVAGDVSVGGQDATLNGSVGRDLAVGSSLATVNGSVQRNLQASSERLTLGNRADITGRVDYTSKNQVKRDNGSQVGGEVKRTEPVQHKKQDDRGSSWLFALWKFIALLALALVVVIFIPHIYHRATSEAMGNLGKTFLVGFIGSIVGPVVLVCLVFTLIGIPLAILFLLGWLVLLILSGTFAAYLAGRYILRNRSDNAIWIMLSGAAVLLIVYYIPVLGALVALLAMWFGLGMVLLQLARAPRFRYRMADVPEAKPADEARARTAKTK